LGNENYDAGHIKSSRGLHLAHRLPTPGLGVQFRYQQAKMAKNLPYLWCHSHKKQNPKHFFLIADLKTCWLF